MIIALREHLCIRQPRQRMGPAIDRTAHYAGRDLVAARRAGFFGLNAVGLMIASQTNGHLMHGFDTCKVLRNATLIHHSDRGSQYVSIRYTERLAEA